MLKSTGIVRKVDDLGRLVIPKELRRTHGIGEGDPLEIHVEGERIILKKWAPSCYICGSTATEKTFMGKNLCQNCLNELGKIGKAK